ncbi:membrane protein [Sphingobacterium griseoflavum]|uniref:Protoporphyrinogen IX oxidase n=2 Tax=Sphingobacterium griseoflavum TaxID=1474952 RepID=A0ABQ3HRU1_9SPHI|nr:membrane protein [Sphingobacterium griseoflavum]
MPRLFIYHTEARQKSPEVYKVLHAQFVLMERRLWWVITTPSMYLMIASAVTMLYLSPGLLTQGWMHVKLAFVGLLVFYHFKSQHIMKQLAAERCSWKSSQLRLWNELATVVLFAIVFLVIFRSAVDWLYGVFGLVGLAVLLMVLIKLYKKYRKSKGEKID